MEKKTIFKLCVAAAIVIAAILFGCGLIGGGEVKYQLPGPYVAESTNSFSTVRVEATIQGDKITDCVITSSGDSDLLNDEIREAWAASIVEAQSADTDVITGATLTYSAASVREAVDDILVQAGLKDPLEVEAAEPETEETGAEGGAVETDDETETAGSSEAEEGAEAEAGVLIDGSYTAESANDFSTVTVDAIVEKGVIADVTVASDGGPTDLLTDEIKSEWAAAIVEAQSADADAITGATLTYSAGSIKEAVDSILAQADGVTPAGDENEAKLAELEAKIAELETAASEAEAKLAEAEARVVELEAAAETASDFNDEMSLEGTNTFFAYAMTTGEVLSEDVQRMMRDRPAAQEATGEEAIEAEEEAAAEALPGNAERMMRDRPAAQEATGEEAVEVEEEAATEALPEDAERMMREKPAAQEATGGEAIEAEKEAAAEALPEDAQRMMREKPAAQETTGEEENEAEKEAAIEALPEDAQRMMREKPAAQETTGGEAIEAEEEAAVEALSEDAQRMMREKPAAQEATGGEAIEAEEEATTEALPEDAEETTSAAEMDDEARLASIMPYIVTSMGDNRENSYVTDYLEQDPYLVNIYEGYGFAKDYGSARGHEYTLEDVSKTQRPHPKANCITCKTPDMHKLVEQEGIAVYSMPFDEVMAQMTQNISCYTCHGADDGNGGALLVTHQYVNEALGENVSAIHPATMSCGQCHIEYYFTPADSETMMPYHSVEEMTPEAILAYYDAIDFADWTQESTGTRMLKAQHPEMETFLQGKHAAFLSCADCHMAPAVTEGGVAYSSHMLVSPLESEALLETCAKCHGDTDMVAFVHGIQDQVTARETEVGNELSGMKDALAAAVASGAWSEEELDSVRRLHREAQWFFDYCYVENSEGAHNSQLSLTCLDTAEAKIQEAMALLDAKAAEA